MPAQGACANNGCTGAFLHRAGAKTGFLTRFMHLSCGKLLLRGCEFYAIDVRLLSKTAGRDLLGVLCSAIESHAAQTQQKRTTEVSSYMRIDSRKPKAAALSAALTVALLAGAGATDAHAATLSDTVGSTPSRRRWYSPLTIAAMVMVPCRSGTPRWRPSAIPRRCALRSS